MKWLNEARVHVVKKGDLATLSIMRTSIVDSYLQAPQFEMKIDPFVKMEDLAVALRKRGMPIDRLEEGYLLVERRWISEDLMDFELLDALSFCYGRLAQMVTGAHAQIAAETSDTVVGLPDQLIQTEGRQPHMISSDEFRSCRLRIASGKFADVKRTHWPVTEDEAAVAKEKYGLTPEDRPSQGFDLMKYAESIFGIAKKCLMVDKELVPVAFLILPDCSIVQCPLVLENRTDKYLIWNAVAADVERFKAWAVVTVSECWVIPVDGDPPIPRAEDSSDRKEAFAVDAISNRGEDFKLMLMFERGENDIVFSEKRSVFDGHAFYLDPIRRVWAKSARDDEANKPAKE